MHNTINKQDTGVKRSSSRTPKRITWGVELATGYDRLKLGLYVVWEDVSFLEILDSAKMEAKEENEAVPISLSEHGDMVFNIHPTGRKGGFGYHLSRGDVHIFLSRRKDLITPNVWIDIGSLSCWCPGYQNILDEIRTMIESFKGEITRDSISEVHLCADFIGLDINTIPIENFDHWITRANLFNAYQDRTRKSGITISQSEGELPAGSPDTVTVKETGVVFGRGNLMCRIYDKVLELRHNKSKQSVFSSVWGNEQYNETSVTRIEYQIRKDVLKQMNIRSLSDLEKNRNGLWRYLTQIWTRFTLKPVDRDNRHQDRMEIHPWWMEVQSINFDDSENSNINRKKYRALKSIEPLIDMMAGLTLSIGTIQNRKPDDLEEVIAFGQGFLEARIREMNEETTERGHNLFKHKMQKRWAEIWPQGYIPDPV